MVSSTRPQKWVRIESSAENPTQAAPESRIFWGRRAAGANAATVTGA
jgi:hypothetical protein